MVLLVWQFVDVLWRFFYVSWVLMGLDRSATMVKGYCHSLEVSADCFGCLMNWWRAAGLCVSANRQLCHRWCRPDARGGRSQTEHTRLRNIQLSGTNLKFYHHEYHLYSVVYIHIFISITAASLYPCVASPQELGELVFEVWALQPGAWKSITHAWWMMSTNYNNAE